MNEHSTSRLTKLSFALIKLLLQRLLDLQVIESYKWRADTLILRIIVYLDPAALRAHPVENLEDGQEDDLDQQEDTWNG